MSSVLIQTWPASTASATTSSSSRWVHGVCASAPTPAAMASSTIPGPWACATTVSPATAAAATTASRVARSGTAPASRLSVALITDAPSATWADTAPSAWLGSATSVVHRGGAHRLALG